MFVELMDDTRGALSDSSLGRVEALTQTGLPEEYRTFLVQTGGGWPTVHWFAYQSLTAASLASLCDLYGPELIESATTTLRNGGYIPFQSLVIGEATGGGQVLLSLEPETSGHVLYWDHDFPDPDRTDDGPYSSFDNIYPLAHSITEFLTDTLCAESTAHERRDTLVTERADPATIPQERRVPKKLRHNIPQAVSDPVEWPTSGLSVYKCGIRPTWGVHEKYSHLLEPAQGSPGIALGKMEEPPPFTRTPSQGDIPAHDFVQLRSPNLIGLTRRAVEEVGDVFERSGELLEVPVPTGKIWLFRCLTILDASTQKEVSYSDLQLDAATVEDAEIFILPQSEFDPLPLFTRPVVKRILDSPLINPAFNEIWTNRTK